MKIPMNNTTGLHIFPAAAGLLVKILTLVILLLAPIFLQAHEVTFPDMETLNRLRLGEIVTAPVRVDEEGVAIKASLMIRAPVEDIWATVYSCEYAFIFLDGLEVCEVPEDDGVDTVTHQIINEGWPVGRQEYTFWTHRAPYTRADIRMVEGKMKFMHAGWDYIKLPDSVVVTYTVRLKPNFPIPQFLLRHSLKSGMIELLACVRGLVGGSGNVGQEEEDLGRCPGDIERVAR